MKKMYALLIVVLLTVCGGCVSPQFGSTEYGGVEGRVGVDIWRAQEFRQAGEPAWETFIKAPVRLAADGSRAWIETFEEYPFLTTIGTVAAMLTVFQITDTGYTWDDLGDALGGGGSKRKTTKLPPPEPEAPASGIGASNGGRILIDGVPIDTLPGNINASGQDSSVIISFPRELLAPVPVE